MLQGNHEFDALVALSARLGADPMLVQAAGGNTSLKHEGTLWIKASGTWLMNASVENIMVPVSLEPLLRALQNDESSAESAINFVPETLNPTGLRPSIETTVHAVLPQRVVLHVHCVNTIAIAIQSTMNATLESLLKSFNWVSVPYVKPGITLSKTIQQVLKNDTDVIVLGNHGLVVAADTVLQASNLLDRVCSALQQPVRPHSNPAYDDLKALCSNSDFMLPNDDEAHAVAGSDVSLDIAAGGSLYPDHVIFLGQGSTLVDGNENPNAVSARCLAAGKPLPMSLIYPGMGVLMHNSSTPGQHALARCLADVTSRVENANKICYLSEQQDHELLNWDAEKYRQSLNKS